MRGRGRRERRKARRASQADAGERRHCLTERAAQRRSEGAASKASGVAKRPNTWTCELAPARERREAQGTDTAGAVAARVRRGRFWLLFAPSKSDSHAAGV